MYDLLKPDKNMTELHLFEIGEVSKVKSSYSFLQVSVTEWPEQALGCICRAVFMSMVGNRQGSVHSKQTWKRQDQEYVGHWSANKMKRAWQTG